MAPRIQKHHIAALGIATCSVAGGALLAYYLKRTLNKFKSQQFERKIEDEITNQQLSVLAKSSNINLRQSAEQMLLDRILSKDAFQEVTDGCISDDEETLLKACTVLCVVLKSVSFNVPFSTKQVMHLITMCLLRSMDREKHFKTHCNDPCFSDRIQRMALATLCDFLSDSVSRKNCLLKTCPEIIPSCLKLIQETRSKEVMRYSVLLIFQITGLGSTVEVNKHNALKVLSEKVMSFHGDHIMQRICLNTIVILLEASEDSKAASESIATRQLLLPTVASCISEDVELCLWSLALIQDLILRDVGIDELTKMPFLIRNFHKILTSREASFRSFVLRILITLCQNRSAFAHDIMEAEGLIKHLPKCFAPLFPLVTRYVLGLLSVLGKQGTKVLQKILDVTEDSIFTSLSSLTITDTVIMQSIMDMVSHFVLAEPLGLRVVKTGLLELIHKISENTTNPDLLYYVTVILVDLTLLSDEIRLEVLRRHSFPVLVKLASGEEAKEKTQTFAVKSIALLHFISEPMEFCVTCNQTNVTITVGDGEPNVIQCDQKINMLTADFLMNKDISCYPIGTAYLNQLEKPEDLEIKDIQQFYDQRAFIGSFIFFSIHGESGSKFLKGLRPYLTLDSETHYGGSITSYPDLLSEGSSCICVCLIGAYKELRVLKISTGEPGMECRIRVPYNRVVSLKTNDLVFKPVVNRLKDLKVQNIAADIEIRDIDLLEVFICLQEYAQKFFSENLAGKFLEYFSLCQSLSAKDVMTNTTLINNCLRVLKLFFTFSTFESGHKALVAADAHGAALSLMNHLLGHRKVKSPGMLSPVSVSSPVFEPAAIPVPPEVSEILSSLPPRPVSRAEPRPVSLDAVASSSEDDVIHVPHVSIADDDGVSVDGPQTTNPSLGTLISEIIAERVIAEIDESGDSKLVIDTTDNVEDSANHNILIKWLILFSASMLEQDHSDNLGLTKLKRDLLKNQAIHSFWISLLSSSANQKTIIELSTRFCLSSLLPSLNLDQNSAMDEFVRFDRSHMTKSLLLSSDCFEVRNEVWTFESVMTTKCIPPDCQERENGPRGWYYEMKLLTDGLIQVGWATEKCVFGPVKGVGVGDDYHSIAFDGSRVKKWHGPAAEQTEENHYGEQWSAGDVISCLIDNNGNASFWLNGKDLGIAFKDLDLKEGWYAACSVCTDQQGVFNFGQKPFQYQDKIPKGFIPLCKVGEECYQSEDRPQESSMSEKSNCDYIQNLSPSPDETKTVELSVGKDMIVENQAELNYNQQPSFASDTLKMEESAREEMSEGTDGQGLVRRIASGSGDQQALKEESFLRLTEKKRDKDVFVIESKTDQELSGLSGGGETGASSYADNVIGSTDGTCLEPVVSVDESNSADDGPIPSLYFEVEVKSCDDRPVAAGFLNANSAEQLYVLLGEGKNVLLPDGSEGPRVADDSVTLGCGAIFPDGNIFFTVNGSPVEQFYTMDDENSGNILLPCCSSKNLSINWGHEEFKYKPANSSDYIPKALSLLWSQCGNS